MAETKHNRGTRVPKAVSVDKRSHQVDTDTMNIPMQNQGRLIGASLLHSGWSRKFSSQTRALARQFNGNLSYSEMLEIIGQEADRLNHIVNNIGSELQRQPLGTNQRRRYFRYQTFKILMKRCKAPLSTNHLKAWQPFQRDIDRD